MVLPVHARTGPLGLPSWVALGRRRWRAWRRPRPGAPRDYPYELERTLRTKDGAEVLLRPILPSDAGRLKLAMTERVCSADTLYRRFGTAGMTLTNGQLRYLTNVDYDHNLALVAQTTHDERLVAVARYHAAAELGLAEPAIVIADRWQNRGLGRALLAVLARAARARGVSGFEALVQHDNRRMLWLIETSGYPTHAHAEGDQLIVTIPLVQAHA